MVATIVSIGEDGITGLAPHAQLIIDRADVLVGGERHLAMVNTASKISLTWAKPIEKTIEVIKTYADRSVCILASGDPL